MLVEQALGQAAEEGRMRNGHTWGVRTHAVTVEDAVADVGKVKVAVCGERVTVAMGDPMIGCQRCQRMLRNAGVKLGTRSQG